MSTPVENLYPRKVRCEYSSTSLARFRTLHPDLQQILTLALQLGFDHAIVCGHRGEEEQTQAYESGNSTVRWPNSKHNKFPSLAVDVAPWYPGIKDLWNAEHCRTFAGVILCIAETLRVAGEIEHEVRWGGDWNRNGDQQDQNLDDLVHFELVTPEQI